MPVTFYEKVTIIIKDNIIGNNNGKKPTPTKSNKSKDQDYEVKISSRVVERTVKRRQIMDKIDKIVAEFLSTRFDDWKPYLTKEEQAVFILKEFKDYSDILIGYEIGYSDRQVRRIYKSARKKINKLIP